jgi:HEAT repeats
VHNAIVKRRFALAILVLLAIAGIAIALGYWLSDPVCEGRPVGAWLRDLQDNSPAVRHRAQDAMRRLGTNAVPLMQRQLHAQDLPWKTNLADLLKHQSIIKPHFVWAGERRIGAAFACVVLGPSAEPLIPDLLQFAKRDSVSFNLAESALASIGPTAVRPLSLLLTNADYNVRMLAAGALATIGPPAKPATPRLMLCLQDHFGATRSRAARALGRIGQVSPEAVRALAEMLADSDLDTRCSAAGSLRIFGRQAMPTIQKLLNDSNPALRAAGTNALKELGFNEPPGVLKPGNL